ncbi:type 1 glutamine amidotransferase [Actinoplanes sp. NPDC051851]|uniref:type 1 glutamine amidotransferase n=1 Tax=Actinoplanes sp. NPDC051851 TaxID=3154753 RepID=UPI00341946C0
MSDRVLLLRHQDDAGPAGLADWMRGQGIPYEIRDVPAEAAAGAHDETDWRAVVVLGSREAAYDDTVPWLAWERDEVGRHLAAGRPVLGICFGAQLLARLEGGEVRPAGTPERGWVTVHSDDPVLAGSWFAWHGDEVRVPAHAAVLARSASCAQAFRVGRHLGVQFHPEVTTDVVRQWLAQRRRQDQLLAVDGTGEEVLRETASRIGAATAAAHRLYATFFTGI